ncbi:MAG: hypothetical protein JWN04_5784 [Myxococcaceae bacterium]|nr:hypothetical protein [Myxococcaceae bacterium]
MRGHRTAWLSMAALSGLSGCYLGAETVSTSGNSLDSGAANLDAGHSTADVRTADTGSADATTATAVILDAGCSSSGVCPASAPLCSAGSCVACQQARDCSRFATTPACAPSGECVTCTSEHTSLCTGDAGVCDSTSNQCVQCNLDADCTSPQAAACREHTCKPCSSDTQCAQFKQVCSAGSCVGCRPETEKVDCRYISTCDPKLAECPGAACDPKLLKCGSRPRQSVGLCQACVSDSECAAAHRCIDTTYNGGPSAKDLGGHCLPIVDPATSCPPAHGFSVQRTSLSGIMGSTYCGVDEALTSCEAVEALDMAKVCTGGDPASCAVYGALCKTVLNTVNSCTYPCSSSHGCPDYAPCGGPSGNRYCGGPQ